MVEFISLIGLSAGVIAILGYLPQIHKSFSLKKMDEVSVWLMILFMSSSFLWTIYGIYKEDTILAGLSAVTFTLATLLIFMKMSYEKKIPNRSRFQKNHQITNTMRAYSNKEGT